MRLVISRGHNLKYYLQSREKRNARLLEITRTFPKESAGFGQGDCHSNYGMMEQRSDDDATCRHMKIIQYRHFN